MVLLVQNARLNETVTAGDGGYTPALNDVSEEQLNSEVETAFKLIEGRRCNEQYEISPEEIARFGGNKPVLDAEPELEPASVQ